MLKNKPALRAALNISEMLECHISDLLSVILNKPVQVFCTDKSEEQGSKHSFFIFRHNNLGNFGLDLNFIYCLNNDFLFFTRLGLVAAALQRSKLQNLFQIRESIDWSKKVVTQPVNVFSGENSEHYLGTTSVMWDGEKINEDFRDPGKTPKRLLKKTVDLEVKTIIPQVVLSEQSALQYPLYELEVEIGINERLAWSASLSESRASGQLNLKIKEKKMQDTLENKPEITLSLGNIAIQLEDFFNLRSGAEIEFEIPEKFDAALLLGQMVFAKANISVEGSVLKLSILKVAGCEAQNEGAEIS